MFDLCLTYYNKCLINVKAKGSWKLALAIVSII